MRSIKRIKRTTVALAAFALGMLGVSSAADAASYYESGVIYCPISPQHLPYTTVIASVATQHYHDFQTSWGPQYINDPWAGANQRTYYYYYSVQNIMVNNSWQTGSSVGYSYSGSGAGCI
jgi:hypothetical protein